MAKSTKKQNAMDMFNSVGTFKKTTSTEKKTEHRIDEIDTNNSATSTPVEKVEDISISQEQAVESPIDIPSETQSDTSKVVLNANISKKEKKSITTSFSLYPSCKRKLAEKAKEYGMSPNELINELIKQL